jgi:hypothetical protein
MDTPGQLITLAPALQWGFAGFSLILVGVIVWMVRRVLDSFDKNTTALQRLSMLIEEVKTTNEDVRDRLLQWECPYGNSRAHVDAPR